MGFGISLLEPVLEPGVLSIQSQAAGQRKAIVARGRRAAQEKRDRASWSSCCRVKSCNLDYGFSTIATTGVEDDGHGGRSPWGVARMNAE